MQPHEHSKKIIAALSLTIIALPLLIISFLLLQQQMVIHTMKEKMESELLHTIILDKKDVYWVKKDKEIRLGLDLFDVKTMVEKNGKVHFTGLYDHEETAIEKKLGDLSGNNGEKQLTVLSGFFSLLQSVFFSRSDITIQVIETESSRIIPDFISSLMQLPQAVPTPPPQQ